MVIRDLLSYALHLQRHFRRPPRSGRSSNSTG